MIEKIFEEIKVEARTGEITIYDEDKYDGIIKRIIRSKFNIVEKELREDTLNFQVKNKENFNKLLTEYVYTALTFYNLEFDSNNVRKLLVFMWSNIAEYEMNNIELFVKKYINFMDDRIFDKNIKAETSIGILYSSVQKQSYLQETPYCFKSYFKESDSYYALPRISFGISNDTCYIYAIQNKDSKINANTEYNKKVHDKMKSINSGINKYRNVTPSFVVALSNFISYLKLYNIDKIIVISPLLVREQNRDLVADYKIKVNSMSGTLSNDEIEKFKEEINNKKINDSYNATTKFINCFNRLKLHFDNLYLNNNTLDREMVIDVMNLISNNDFLQQIVDKNNISVVKSL